MVGLSRQAGTIALLLALAATPAWATITVSVSPANQIVNIADGTATIDIIANIPQADAIVGWGLDLGLLGSSVSVSSIAINDALFDGVAALDGDGLAALVDFPGTPVFSDPGDVLLATITLNLLLEGDTDLLLSDDNDSDLTEGFALAPPPAGAFAEVAYVDGMISVVPEPATACLLGVLAVGFLRRRR
jgi:hypothetical protein